MRRAVSDMIRILPLLALLDTIGYAYAEVRIAAGSSWTGNYKEWSYKKVENWGGAVEIKGKVP